jgi:hypothetical protein
VGWFYGQGCGEYYVKAEMPYYGFTNALSQGRIIASNTGPVYQYWRKVGGVWALQGQAPVPASGSECSPSDLSVDYWSVGWAIVVACILAFGVNHILRRFVGS